jgi:hypothetical protein
MPDVNLEALREHHLAEERWERCRAAWFKLCGNNAASRECLCRAKDSLKIARNAQVHMKKRP